MVPSNFMWFVLMTLSLSHWCTTIIPAGSRTCKFWYRININRKRCETWLYFIFYLFDIFLNFEYRGGGGGDVCVLCVGGMCGWVGGMCGWVGGVEGGGGGGWVGCIWLCHCVARPATPNMCSNALRSVNRMNTNYKTRFKQLTTNITEEWFITMTS